MTTSNPRSADAAIAGYLYQFDKSIIEILEAPENGTVVIEGYEDVDIQGGNATTAVQCKYHAGGSFSLPGIRKPILAMLHSFDAGHQYQYRLYAHYGKPKGPVPERLTLDELKKVLTKKGREETVRYHKDFATSTLEAFIGHLTIHEGPPIDVQRASLLVKLRGVLGGSPADAMDLHYPSAVSMVLDLAATPDTQTRTIARADFVESLDKRRSMFTRWHQEFLGADHYLKAVVGQIKTQDLARSTFRRMAVIGSQEMESGSETTRVIDLVRLISRIRFGIGRLPQARPWTVVLESTDEQAKAIKEDLVREGLVFHDGFEHLAFNPDIFDRPALINTGKQHKKVSAVAYDVRLVSLSTVQAHAASLMAPDVMLNFRGDPPDIEWTSQQPRMLNVAGCNLEQLAEIFGRLS